MSLSGKNKFKLLEKDQSVQLKNQTLKMLNSWREKCFLGINVRRCLVSSENTVLSRCYGLYKIHKKDFPLKIVVSTINSPTRRMKECLNNILKSIISYSEISVKNSFKFVERIKNVSYTEVFQ